MEFSISTQKKRCGSHQENRSIVRPRLSVMAIGIALAAEEHGKIVSARHFCNAVKSYLPTHGTFHKIAHCALCIFADAIRKECAEAKHICNYHFCGTYGRNSQGVRRGKAPRRSGCCPSSGTRSARSAPRQSVAMSGSSSRFSGRSEIFRARPECCADVSRQNKSP